MRAPLVSVIIPTKNSGATIETCLKSIKRQTYPRLEIIVVDNYSEDKTVVIARRYGAKILLKKLGRSAARNYGAKHAKGEFLLSVDSDFELTPTVVEECIEKTLKGYDTIIIPEITIGTTFWCKVRALERATYIGDSMFEAARFFRREVFKRLGGYDEELTGFEDFDLQARLEKRGCKVTHINSRVLHHEGELKLRDHLQKKCYYVRTGVKYFSKHPDRAKIQFLPIRRSYIRHFWMLVKNPAYAVGLAILKVCEYAVGMFGYLSKYGKKETQSRTSAILTTPGDLAKIKIIGGMINRRGLILDLGCGNGLCVPTLSKLGGVIGLDLSKDKLRVAKEIHRYADFILADAQSLPFRGEVFDVIVAKDVFEHIVYDKKVMSEVSRVSKHLAEIITYVPISLEEARFSIENPVYKLTGYSIDKQVGHVRRYTANNLLAMLKENGFKPTEKNYFAHILSSSFALLLIIGYEILKKRKRGKIGNSKFRNAIIRLFEPLCLLEFKIFRGLPGAGLFVRALKI